jgi:hypothetical protein
LAQVVAEAAQGGGLMDGRVRHERGQGRVHLLVVEQIEGAEARAV